MHRAILAVGIGLCCLVASAVDAAVVTRSFDLRASNFFNVEDGSPGPMNEIVGSFTVTFDQNLMTIEPTTVGLNVNRFDLDFDGVVSFTVGYETLVIGTNLFPGGFSLNRQPRDFGLIIGLTNEFARFAYSDGIDSVFEARSVNVTSGASAVPEPSAWLMMIGGFGITGGVLRRKKIIAKASVVVT